MCGGVDIGGGAVLLTPALGACAVTVVLTMCGGLVGLQPVSIDTAARAASDPQRRATRPAGAVGLCWWRVDEVMSGTVAAGSDTACTVQCPVVMFGLSSQGAADFSEDLGQPGFVF